jgi:CubicO group peptidase (beta-lactamase class C family)
MLRPYLEEYRLPAVAAAIVRNGEITAAGAVGTRRAGADIPVTINDRFHIGSDTKAMTALLAAMMVEERRLRWDSTVAEVFPELKETADPRFKAIDLTQLLSHTSGVSPDNAEVFEIYQQGLAQDELNLDEMRYWLLQRFAKRPLQSAPGAAFAYSNAGFTLAGAMIERVSGKTWDELVTERVFEPLGLKTAGIGSQASLGRVDAPLGHSAADGRTKAFLAGPGDGPIIIGPAGLAYMSVLDFARWAGWNAGQGRRGPALVKADTLKKLHTPVIDMPKPQDPPPGTPRGGKYALGWGQMEVDWAPYPLIYHGGSNSLNLAHIWLDPRKDLAIVIMTNIGGAGAKNALLALEAELYRKFAQ